MKLNSKSINCNVQTVDELVSLDGLEGDTVVVTDEDRGGVFVYREDNVGTNNGGTIFNGWTRQYSGAVNVKWFGAKGDGVTDDTVAIQSAVNSQSSVFIPKGIFLIDDSYTIDSGVELNSNQNIFGVGADSILLQGSSRFIMSIGGNDYGTSDAKDNKRDIKIHNITFQNNSGVFLEHKHLLQISASTNVSVDSCFFIGSQGDGIYIGSAVSTVGIERHNINISITNCTFDGVNNQNRNSISIIDGDGIYIDRCTFMNYSKIGMPGAIDFEPNDSFAVCRNIYITNSSFYGILGDAAFVLRTTALTSPIKNIKFNNNYCDSTCSFSGCAVLIVNTQNITENTATMGIDISGNNFNGCVNGFVAVIGIKGATINSNMFTNTTGPVCIGQQEGNSISQTYDVIFSNNMMKNSGDSGGQLKIGEAKRIFIFNNTFDSPSTGEAAITFVGVSVVTTSSYVSILRNTFINSPSMTKLINLNGHTLTNPSTNKFSKNTISSSLPSEFLHSGDSDIYDSDIGSFSLNTFSNGEVIEVGSNANGEYIKFANGTAMSFGRKTTTGLSIAPNIGISSETYAPAPSTYFASFLYFSHEISAKDVTGRQVYVGKVGYRSISNEIFVSTGWNIDSHPKWDSVSTINITTIECSRLVIGRWK